MAFAGGLFMPAELFPDWMNTFSKALPSRAGRDLVIGVFADTEVYSGALWVLLAWGVVFTVLAVWGPPLPLTHPPPIPPNRWFR